MKKRCLNFAVVVAVLLLFNITGVTADAKTADVIKTGVYADSIDLSGMTTKEAEDAIEDYVEALDEVELTFLVTEGNEVTFTAGELGLEWENREIVQEAVMLGTEGNIVQRYKALADLARENKVYNIEITVDKDTVKALIEERCAEYNVEAVDYSLVREGESFRVVAGQTGLKVDAETSADKVTEYVKNEWDRGPAQIALEIVVDEPLGSEEELSQIKDVLGTCTTSYSTSGSSRSANVANGCNLINGTMVYPGEEFSAYEAIAPFSTENGYYLAGSYLNGQVVESLGGGICQVSTTLYNAVLQAELEVTERHNHSMIVTYVEPSADAAIAESSGKDFRFINNTEYPIYIEGYTTPDKQITFNIYGVETRDPGRVVTYESEILSVTNPNTEMIYTDAARPVGYVSAVQSAHIGYKAQLWKVVTVNGVEESREQINSSSYKMTPRSVTIGVATDNPDVYNQIMAAVATSNIDYVRGVAGALATGGEVPAAPVVPEAPVEQPQPEQPQPQPEQPQPQPEPQPEPQPQPEGEVPPI